MTACLTSGYSWSSCPEWQTTCTGALHCTGCVHWQLFCRSLHCCSCHAWHSTSGLLASHWGQHSGGYAFDSAWIFWTVCFLVRRDLCDMYMQHSDALSKFLAMVAEWEEAFFLCCLLDPARWFQLRVFSCIFILLWYSLDVYHGCVFHLIQQMTLWLHCGHYLLSWTCLVSIDFERVSEICAFDTFGISSWLFEVAASFQVETANITHVGDAACARFHSEKEPILATSWLWGFLAFKLGSLT